MNSILISVLATIVLWLLFLFRNKNKSDNSPVRSLMSYEGNWIFREPKGMLVDVVGEAHHNSDGSSRHVIISKLSIGDSINLIPEPNNRYSKNKNAVAVYSTFGQIGYLPDDEDSTKLIFDRLIEGLATEASILSIFGGIPTRPNFGVKLDVDISYRAERERKQLKKKRGKK